MKRLISIITIPLQIYFLIIQFWPGPVGNKLRYWYWRSRLGGMGKDVVISEGVHIDSPENVFIGDHSWIDKNVLLLAGAPDPKRRITHFKTNSAFTGKIGEIHIGTDCHIAPFVLISGLGGFQIGARSGIGSGSKIYSYSHHYRDFNDPNDVRNYSTTMAADKNQSMISGPIVIGSDCALGVNCIMMPGVQFGTGSWLKAGSTAMTDIPEQSVSDGSKHQPKFNLNKSDT